LEDSLNESHPDYIYVNTDVHLDPDGELLPTERFIEVRTAASREGDCLSKRRTECLNPKHLMLTRMSSDESEDMEALSSNDDGAPL
jgi:hypothetical protein